MVVIFYGALAAGVALLVEDIRGRLVVAPGRHRWLIAIGIAAAGGAALAPLLAWLIGRLEVTWPFPLIAIGYVVSFLIFASGVLGFAGARLSVGLRRVGYIGLLALAALPSFVLLVLAPLVGLAGVALARPAAERPAQH